MSIARNMRRKHKAEHSQHLAKLANLLGDFYELLSSTPQPSDETIRSTFIKYNDNWQEYCRNHKLMNADHLFVFNVRQAWERHTQKPEEDLNQK
jgi:hypothetical protein